MKYQINFIPQNAFLKVSVEGRQRRLYFKDVKTYKKVPKCRTPAIPAFESSVDWEGSAVTNCGSDYGRELTLKGGNC